MRKRAVFGQALTLVAATLLIIELGEFLMLAYVWLFASDAKEVAPSDSTVVMAVTVLTVGATFLGCMASLLSVALRRAWPSTGLFVGIALSLAVTQAAFLLLGVFSPSSSWLADFFASKMPSFASGTLSALALVLVGLFIRPWKVA